MQRISTTSITKVICMGSGLCRCEKFRKFLMMGRARSKISFSAVSCAQPTTKVLIQTNSTAGKHTLRKCVFWFGVLTHQYQEPQMENSKPTKHSAFHKFISFILSSYRWIQRYDYFSNPSKWYCLKKLMRYGRLQLTLVVNTALVYIYVCSSSFHVTTRA